MKRTAFFWVIMQWVVVISYWCFGTAYWSHPHGSRIQETTHIWGYRISFWILWILEIYLKNYIFFLCSPNIYFLYSCLLLRIKTFLKRSQIFIVLIQDLIMTYIFPQQIWQYFRKEYGILVLKFITIFHQPLNSYYMIFRNLKQT
jgi:hypothetical protein